MDLEEQERVILKETTKGPDSLFLVGHVSTI